MSSRFWRRAAAALVDLAIIAPLALLVTFIASKLAGVHLPPSNFKLLDVDLWIDLVLATDPALLMGLGLAVAIGLTYLLVFQIVLGRTLGMRVLGIKIIDVYGDRPTPARCIARCAGYVRVPPRCVSASCGWASTARSAGSKTGSLGPT